MKPTILCIEDNPDNMMLVKRVIESLGFSLFGATGGESGLAIASDLKPGLILLDINLPDIDGYEVARRFRSSSDPYMASVPIIAITANALRGDAEKVLAAGCDVYMSKPINIHELLARVEAILGDITESN